MSPARPILQTKVDEMRRRFDESFAAPVRELTRDTEQMLTIITAGERFAVRLRDISGLTTLSGRLLPVPSSVPELLGITGIRGAVVPVFSLAAMLGLRPSGEPVHWLLLCGGKQAAIALAFDAMQRHIEVARSEIFNGEAEFARRYVIETARHEGVLHAIVNVPAIVEQIRARGMAAGK